MKKWIPIALCLLLPAVALAQSNEYTILGTVVDQYEEPLAGANVTIDNMAVGASADREGSFEITANVAPGDYTLQISFVGFKREQRELTLDADTQVDLGNVVLQEDIIGTEELVITGASALTSKKQFGNSISTVDAEELQSTGATQIDQALAGKIAGAFIQQSSGDPAGGISVRLRGTGTLLGQASPLYIVDGVIVNNDSPELIDVGGTATNRLVDLNPEDIERIEVVKGAAAAALYGSRANNGVVQIFTKEGAYGQTNITYSSKVNIDHIRKTLDVNMAQNADGDFLGNDGSILEGRRYDLQDEIFRTAVGTNQYLSVSGGSEDTRYFISGSYKSNQGIVDNSDFKRATARLNLDQNLSEWADLAVTLNYSNSRSNEMPNGGLNASYGILTGFIFGPNTVNPFPDEETGEFPRIGSQVNPLEGLATYDFNSEVNRVLGSAKLTLLPLDGLSIDHTLGVDTYSQVGTAFIPPGTTAPGLTTGFGRRSEREFFQMNNDLNIRYQTTLAASFESTTLAGGTLQYENSETIGLQAEMFAPGSEVVTGGADFDQPREFRSETVIYGVFAQQTFGLNDRYFLTGAGRFDASSVFAKDERWQFFPKLSGSYVVSEEEFWENSLGSVINSFKLRGSIGFSGGQTAIGAFDRFNLFSPASVNGRSALIPSSQRGALDVKPERQQELELGIDASLFDDRLAVEFTWYDQHTDDLLLFRTTAPSTGFLSQLGNFGELDNTGIEFLIKGVPVNNGRVQWASTVTFAANKNEVSGIEGGTLIIPESFGQVAAINGEPLGVFFSDAFARDEDGDIVIDDDGLPVEAPNDQIIGDPNPDWTGSFINAVSVGKNWNFRAQLDVSYGGDIFNFTERLGSLSAFGTLETYERELEGDLPPGYNGRVFGIFENWIEDGSYLKLRELSASYTLFPESIGLRSIRFSVIGRNLFSVDEYNGYDPETNVGGQRTAVRGFDFVQVPIPRSVTFGVTANF
jgi:TonB-linked SusC/RagA family outer membrane protein